MRWGLTISTRYEYDRGSNRPPLLEGIASRSTVDSEGDLIESFDEDSLEYLEKWGKLDFNHNGVAIGQILRAELIPERDLYLYVQKGFVDPEPMSLYIVGQLFPLGPRSHPDLKEVYYLIESQAKLGFSIEGRPTEIQRVPFAKSHRRVIRGLKLHPRVSVTPTPVHPEAGVVLVKSYNVDNNRPQVFITCGACAYSYIGKQSESVCPHCGKLVFGG